MSSLAHALLMIVSVSQVAALRPSDLAAEGAEQLARESPAALLQTGDLDPDMAKEDFKKVFLEVQTIEASGPGGVISSTIDKNTGLFASDGMWMKAFEGVEDIWKNIADDQYVADYKDTLSDGYVERIAEINRGLQELRRMVNKWLWLIRREISKTEPPMSSDMDDETDYLGLLQAYNKEHQTLLVAFMKAFSLEQLHHDTKLAGLAVKELLSLRTGKTIDTNGFVTNSFLAPLYLIGKNIDTWNELARGFKDSTLLGPTQFGSSRELAGAELTMHTMLDLPAFANRALVNHEDALTDHCELPDRITKSDHDVIVSKLSSGLGLIRSGRDPTNNFEAYMDGILFFDAGVEAWKQYTKVLEAAIAVIPRTDPPKFLFGFTVPDDWDTRYPL